MHTFQSATMKNKKTKVLKLPYNLTVAMIKFNANFLSPIKKKIPLHFSTGYTYL